MAYERVVWITGASAGIGKALLETLPWKETLVIGVSRSGLPRPRPVRAGIELQSLAADLTEQAAWDALESSFSEHLHPRLVEAMFIHAAASVGPLGFAGEVDSASYRGAVMLNTAAPLVLGEAFVRAVTEEGVRAQVLMLTSGAGIYPGWSAYKAGKAELNAWVETTGRTLEEEGIPCRVVAVAPGLVETSMQEVLRGADAAAFPAKQKFVEAARTRQTSEPADVAGQLWRVLETDEAANGAVLDLREFETEGPGRLPPAGE